MPQRIDVMGESPSLRNHSLTIIPDAHGMTAYRRLILPEGTYFFTVCLEDRQAATLVDHVDQLRAAYAFTAREMPVQCHAMVVLPNHLHAIWTEPGIPKFSERWRRIKARFSDAVAGDFAPSASKQARQERDIWQRRFYEHAVRDDRELEAAMEYCRMNPVKHGFVAEPEQWAYSSFSRRTEVLGESPILRVQNA
jgi:putative transposase